MDVLPQGDIDFAVVVGVDKSGRPFISRIGELNEFRLAGCREILDCAVRKIYEAMLDEGPEGEDEEVYLS